MANHIHLSWKDWIPHDVVAFCVGISASQMMMLEEARVEQQIQHGKPLIHHVPPCCKRWIVWEVTDGTLSILQTSRNRFEPELLSSQTCCAAVHIKWCETHSQRNNHSHCLPAICVWSDPVPRYNGKTAHHPKSTKPKRKNLIANAAPLVIHVHLFNLCFSWQRTRKSARTFLESVHYLGQLCKKREMAHRTMSNQQAEEFPKAIFATSLMLIYITGDNWLILSSLSWSKAARKPSNCSCYSGPNLTR